MKIGLIRHFEVNQSFLKGMVSQSEVLNWFHLYNNATINTLPIKLEDNWDVCYSSQLLRARQTAEHLFSKDIVFSEFLNEPFPNPIFKKDYRMPFKLWALMIRLAIICNHSSQTHKKEVLEVRIKKFLAEITSKEDQNILVISHAFIMEILSRQLLKAGFRGKKLNMPHYGILYLYSKD